MDRRAAGLAQLYKRALKRLDSRYNHTAADQTGPLARRLQSFGKRDRPRLVSLWQNISHVKF